MFTRKPKPHNTKTPRNTTPLRQIAGHVTMTAHRGAAWYRLAGVPWSFRPDRDREAHLINGASVLAMLTNREIQLRSTTTPFPVQSWAEQHHTRVVNHAREHGLTVLPAWTDLLEGEQLAFLGDHQSEKEVFVGVDFLRRSMAAETAAMLMPRRVGPLSRELERQRSKLDGLDVLMARPGMRGRPVTPQEMAWLLHRSSHLGFPAPARRLSLAVDEWATEDLADLLGQVSWTAEPYSSTLQVTGMLDGRTITRHVAILTVGRMQPMQIPQGDRTWMTIGDSLGIPLEWSAHITPRATADVQAEVRLTLGKISSQLRHYEVEHEMDAPTSLQAQRDLALQVEEELSTLNDPSLARAKGWWRVAVSGDSKEECLSHVERLTTAYASSLDLVHTYGQHALAQEFLPGSAVTLTAHMRKLPLRTVAAAGPAVTSMAGDRVGWNLGRAALDGSPVMMDFWLNMEIYDVSGLFPVISALGGGKSTLLGGIIGRTALAGIPWCVLDPAGRLGRLGRTAQLRSVSRNWDLLNGAAGSLNPYALVREPKLSDFDALDLTDLDDNEAQILGLRAEEIDTVKVTDLDPQRVNQLRQKRFNDATIRAMATRTRLCMDSLIQILPATYAVTGRDAGAIATELRLAAQKVNDPRGQFAGRPKHPGLIIEALRLSKTKDRSVALSTADLLVSIAQEPQPALLFPGSDDEVDAFDDIADRQLTFLSLKGVVLPDPDVRPEFWQDEARQGVAMLNLTSWKTLRWMYGLPAAVRKGCALDEVHFLNGVPSGQLLLKEFSRNSRKQNLLCLAAGQDPGDTLASDRGGNNFVGGAFLGRMDDAEAATRALRIAQIPAGQDYETTLLDFPKPTMENPDVARQFLFYNRGGDGFKEVITVSRGAEHNAWIWEALESAPGQRFTKAGAA